MRYGESGHFNTTTGTGLDEVTEVEARLSPSFFVLFFSRVLSLSRGMG